jgi:hypothetical protein
VRPTFLEGQFQYLCRGFRSRTRLRRKLSFFIEIIRLLRNSARMRLALMSAAPPAATTNKKCVVILLSHNRPQNLPVLVKGALQSGCVSKVIVSNSNSKFRLKDWVAIQDSRLVLVDETARTLPGHRFVLANRESGDWFLSVDDDIFLTPRQWAAFVEHLMADPETPHGITGHQYRPGVMFTNGSEFHHLESEEKEVDVLIGAYAFTRRHLERLFALSRMLGIDCLSDVGNGEDILLSFAGIRPPRIHDLGPTFLCASTSLPGVALWTTRQAFWEERVNMLEKVREARLAMDAPWLTRGTHALAQPRSLEAAS